MIKLGTYVNEKLRVTKNSTIIPGVIDFLESKDEKEFDSRREQLLEYLKNDSHLSIAELQVRRGGIKEISTKYENGHDVFLVVLEDIIFYGTWDNVYYITWNNKKGYVENGSYEYGFSRFTMSDREISDYVGIFIITENEVLMEQIDYLIKNAEPRS